MTLALIAMGFYQLCTGFLLAFRAYFLHPAADMKDHYFTSLPSAFFPASPPWSSQNNSLPYSLTREWRECLFNKESLTAQLVALGDGDFAVEVLWQGWKRFSPGECQALGLAQGQYGWIREVALKVKGKTMVYARTCIPRATLTGSERYLIKLGNRSLGSVLFNHPRMSRGKMRALKIKQNGFNKLDIQWARNSIFYLNHKPLLVTEAFTRSIPPLK